MASFPLQSLVGLGDQWNILQTQVDLGKDIPGMLNRNCGIEKQRLFSKAGHRIERHEMVGSQDRCPGPVGYATRQESW